MRLDSSPLSPPTTLLSLGNRLAVVGGVSFFYIKFFKRGKVSAAASGPAPRWGASRTDRSGNGDRRRTLSTGELRPLATPLRSVNFYLAASFANAKLDRVSCTKCNLTRAHIPQGHAYPQPSTKRGSKGAEPLWKGKFRKKKSPSHAGRPSSTTW